MLRQDEMPLQLDRPVFVKVPFTAGGRKLKKNQEFKWKELSVDEKTVLTFYNQRMIYHNSDLEIERKVGDGLEELDVTGLHVVVDNINTKVKAKTSSQADFDRKKCKKSKIADKQRGLIRSWRRTYGRYEVD